MITSLLIFLIVVLGVYVASHSLSGTQIAFAAVVLISGLVLVISPDVAIYAARALNVGRGSDLVIYLLLVFGLFVSANFYFRFKQSEQQIVEVVRAIALLDARAGRND